jgi:hypothetical protein
MEIIKSYCQGCNCEIINIRETKGRLKKWCSHACRSKWRYHNTPKMKQAIQHNTAERQKRVGYERKWNFIQSLGGACVECGETNPSKLCFHHKNPLEKSLKLDARSISNNKMDLLQEEVNKCELLCHNCHQALHNENSWTEFFEKCSKDPRCKLSAPPPESLTKVVTDNSS